MPVAHKNTAEYKLAKETDLVWRLVHFVQSKTAVPGWKGFNSLFSEKEPQVTRVRYLPFIHASPSDFSTIFTALLALTKIADQLGQSHIMITADMSIYMKAQEIIWNNPNELRNRVTMCLGGMHLTMAYIASIGYLLGDGGLLSIWGESDIYAEATARQMLQGKQYSRAIHGLHAGEAL